MRFNTTLVKKQAYLSASGLGMLALSTHLLHMCQQRAIGWIPIPRCRRTVKYIFNAVHFSFNRLCSTKRHSCIELNKLYEESVWEQTEWCDWKNTGIINETCKSTSLWNKRWSDSNLRKKKKRQCLRWYGIVDCIYLNANWHTFVASLELRGQAGSNCEIATARNDFTALFIHKQRINKT